MSNEVAIQQALMRADAALTKCAGLESRLAILESVLRVPASGGGGPVLGAPVTSAPALTASPVGGSGTATPPGATGAGGVSAAFAPWAGLVQSLVEAVAADVGPLVRSLLAAGQTGQEPSAAAVLSVQQVLAQRQATPPPQERPKPPSAAPPAQVSVSELGWLADEGVPVGEVAPATQTAALPPGYQHPPGVRPSPDPALPGSG